MPAAPRPPERLRPVDLVLPVGAVLALVATLVLQRSSSLVLWDDEGTYVWVAAGLARGDLWSQLPGSKLYSIGYPLILAGPLAVIGAERALWAVVAANVAAWGVLGVCLYRLARRPFDLDRPAAIAVASAGCCYPAVLLQMPRAWPEVLLTAAVGVFAVLVARYLERPALERWLPIAAVAGAAYVVHHRSLPLAVVAALLPLLADARRRHHWILGGAGLVWVVALFPLGQWLDGLSQPPVGAEQRTERISNALSPSAWIDVAGGFAGQFWSLQVATLGLAFVAVAGVLVPGDPLRRRWSAAFGLTVAGLGGLSAMFLEATTAPDHVLYTRYLDVVGPVAVVAGLASLARHAPSRRLLAVGWVVAVAALGLARWIRLDDFEGPIVKIRIVSLLALDVVWSDFGSSITRVVDVVPITATAVALSIVVALAARRHERLGATVAAAVLGGLAALAAGWSLQPWLNITEGTGSEAAAILQSQDETVVAVVPGGEAPQVARAVAWRSGFEVQPVYYDTDHCPPGRFFLAPPDPVLPLEFKAVGDGRPFDVVLYEVLACDLD